MSRADDLLFDVSPVEDTRTPPHGRRSRPWPMLLLLLPAVVLTTLLLIAPLVATAVEGYGHIGVLLDNEQVRQATANSLRFVALVPVICLAGFLLALLTRAVPPLMRKVLLAALIIPSVASPLVVGVTYRLLFDPDPARGTVSALLPDENLSAFLGQDGIGLILALAFAWQWTGLAVFVLDLGLAGLPSRLLRAAKAMGAGPLRRLCTVALPAFSPSAALSLLIVLVAAVRVFELVMITAPGSMQDRTAVIGLVWWRQGNELGEGASAALSMSMYAVVIVLAAVLALWGLAGQRPAGELPAERALPRTRPAGPAIGLVTAAVWSLPLLVLGLTSVREPKEAALSGWWSGGYGLGSYAEAFAGGELAGALTTTAVRALVAAALVVSVAAPAAFVLTWGGLPRTVRLTLIALAGVLAVAPPQAVAGPLFSTLKGLGVLGAPAFLTLIYAALGLPLAILMLRNAFASVPHSEVRRDLMRPDPGTALFTVLTHRRSALVAVAVVQFVLVWNDLVVGLVLGGSTAGQVTTAMVGQARQFVTSSGPLAAGSMTALLITLLVIGSTWRHLLPGLRLCLGTHTREGRR
ncbi:ABC transporter permease subunit [Nonomuraea sp. NPDC000554]|uniref:ABC transporter permease subunit n=1 Tax=Nonomuraea sp. NPDC000554 TaxID=3154259 RepID=UPI0033202E10